MREAIFMSMTKTSQSLTASTQNEWSNCWKYPFFSLRVKQVENQFKPIVFSYFFLQRLRALHVSRLLKKIIYRCIPPHMLYWSHVLFTCLLKRVAPQYKVSCDSFTPWVASLHLLLSHHNCKAFVSSFLHDSIQMRFRIEQRTATSLINHPKDSHTRTQTNHI